MYIDTLDHWSYRLSARGIDRGAFNDWAALYSASPFRKQQAMLIFHKVIKKDHGGPGWSVRNPSAFIASSLRDAWRLDDPTFAAPVAPGQSASTSSSCWGRASDAWWYSN